MTWEQLIQAIRAVMADDVPMDEGCETKPMVGVQHDNRTVPNAQPSVIRNDSGSLLLAHHEDRDWCCITVGQVIIDKAPYLPGAAGVGHITLAGRQPVICAGRIEKIEGKTSFIFWSGHYRPQLKHATQFLLAFVYNSIAGLPEAERQSVLDDLCSLQVTYFIDETSRECKTETIGQIIQRKIPTNFTASNASSHSRSNSYDAKSPHDKSKWTTSSPRSNDNTNNNAIVSDNNYTSNNTSSALSNVNTALSTGTNSTARRQSYTNLVTGIPTVVPHSSITACQCCKRSFNAFLGKVNCFSCGTVVCRICRKNTRKLRSPAKMTGETITDDKYPVCDTCISSNFNNIIPEQ